MILTRMTVMTSFYNTSVTVPFIFVHIPRVTISVSFNIHRLIVLIHCFSILRKRIQIKSFRSKCYKNAQVSGGVPFEYTTLGGLTAAHSNREVEVGKLGNELGGVQIHFHHFPPFAYEFSFANGNDDCSSPVDKSKEN